MKFFKNKAEDIVKEAILGLIETNNKLAVLDSFPEIKVVVRKDWDKSKVALISGGGSGHEPAHAGFVGEGMLTAAVCGEIFASPTVDAVLSAIVAVTGEAGCLLIVKNYTGDRLNFGLAAEQAKALGYKVEMIVVNDDVALGINKNSRGIAGTVFLHKVLGAFAAEGKSLSEIATLAEDLNKNIYSLGLSLTECQRFTSETEGRISDDKVELGLGIHGEPGAKNIDYQDANALATVVADNLWAAIEGAANKRFAVMINNLGTATPLEMQIIANAIRATKLGAASSFVVGPAPIMTALNMNGFSISVLVLNDSTEKALLAPTPIKNWPDAKAWNDSKEIAYPALPSTIQAEGSADANVSSVVEKMARQFIAQEAEINALDAQVGDGDAGTTFATTGKNILKYREQLPFADPAALLQTFGRILARESGGSSGVLLSILFTASGNAYKETANWGEAFQKGLERMQAYGGAKQGSRTMVDVLVPLFDAWAAGDDLASVKAAVRKGADSTKEIFKTEFGRSSYVPEEVLKNVPDPGAEAIARAIESL